PASASNAACSRKSAGPGKRGSSEPGLPTGASVALDSMAIGQNDDIEPATATGRVPAASRACSAARTALRLASATGLPSPAGSSAARLAANVFAMITSAPARIYASWTRCTTSGRSRFARALHASSSIGTPSAWSSLPMPPSMITSSPSASLPEITSATPIPGPFPAAAWRTNPHSPALTPARKGPKVGLLGLQVAGQAEEGEQGRAGETRDPTDGGALDGEAHDSVGGGPVAAGVAHICGHGGLHVGPGRDERDLVQAPAGGNSGQELADCFPAPVSE